MTTRLKKIICAMSTTMCILGSSIPAYAADFNVTPPNDPYSYSVKKADSEQRFYVTGTHFNKTGKLFCYSQQTSNKSIKSVTGWVTPTSTKDNRAYTRYANAGESFEMYSYTTTSNLNVVGRYNP